LGHVFNPFLISDSVNELKGKNDYNKTRNIIYYVMPKHLTSAHFKYKVRYFTNEFCERAPKGAERFKFEYFKF